MPRPVTMSRTGTSYGTGMDAEIGNDDDRRASEFVQPQRRDGDSPTCLHTREGRCAHPYTDARLRLPLFGYVRKLAGKLARRTARTDAFICVLANASSAPASRPDRQRIGGQQPWRDSVAARLCAVGRGFAVVPLASGHCNVRRR